MQHKTLSLNGSCRTKLIHTNKRWRRFYRSAQCRSLIKDNDDDDDLFHYARVAFLLLLLSTALSLCLRDKQKQFFVHFHLMDNGFVYFSQVFPPFFSLSCWWLKFFLCSRMDCKYFYSINRASLKSISFVRKINYNFN